jgi:hypothetical protein
MLKVNQLAGFGVIPNTVIHNLYSFDGSASTYLQKTASFSGEADGKAGTVQFWCRLNGKDNGTHNIYMQGISGSPPTLYFNIGRSSGNKIYLTGFSSAGTKVLHIETLSQIIVNTGLFHCMASFNLATSAAHLYINNASDYDTSTDVLTNTNINFDATPSPRMIVGVSINPQANTALNGCLGGLYISRTYLDLSNSANRAKFYSTGNISNTPQFSVDLGADGSTPESAQPIVYLNNGLSAGTNAGSGGNFTVNGVIDGC